MVKVNSKSQSGRSMVEMLGVLAIVGVLSVGGVYGYGVAMKKHKANELLHQASMLATTISAQIASGKTDLALENFGNSSNGSFSSVKGPDGSSNYQSGDDKFTMQITGMDSAVCEQMQGMKGGTVRSVSCGTPDANGKVTATLAFNKDLSSTPVASDYNDDTTGGKCEGAGYKWCDGKCKTDCCDGKCTTGQTCVSGSCMNAECKNSDCSCVALGKVDSNNCSAEKPYCVYQEDGYDGVCVTTAEEAPCKGDPNSCSGTDAPYCSEYGVKCSKEPVNVYCVSNDDCRIVTNLGYCVNYKCYSSALGEECYDVGHCAETDAPYCNKQTNKCSTEMEGAVCMTNENCGTGYCVRGICYTTATKAHCSSNSDCEGTDAEYCNWNSGYCQKDLEGSYCTTSSDCSGLYCCQGTNSCCKTAVGSRCEEASDCQGTDAMYCDGGNGVCSKDSERALCQSDSDCNGKYCYQGMHMCFTSTEGLPCDSEYACVGTDAPYCKEVDGSMRCSK